MEATNCWSLVSKDYRELVPHPALARFVDRFWMRSAVDPTPAHILPDGCLDIVIDATDLDRATVVGAMTRALAFAPRGPIQLVAVRFRPGAATSFLGVSADELTDLTVSSAELGMRWLEPAKIMGQDNPANGLRRLQRTLLSRLSSIAAPNPGIAHAVAALSRGSPPTIAELARELGWTRQHLGRAFRQHVGVSAKQFARTARLQRAIAELQRGADLGLADAALRTGYFDQAHMNRDFRDLAGVTPRIAAAAECSIRPIHSIFDAR